MKKRKTLFIDHNWMYSLTEGTDGGLYIEVAVGGIAIENYVIPLSAEERQQYSDEGNSFLHRFALNIAKDPMSFTSRRI